jgi:hypothetical protein
MSDFASLLSGLKKTVHQTKRKWEAPSSSSPRDHRNKKRNLSSSSSPRPLLPRDISDLHISLSFLCIGAQKAGTTWLDEMLRKIPHVALPTQQKEVHFWDWHRSKGLGWYSRQWNQQQQQQVAPRDDDTTFHGEVTPCYAVLPVQDVREIHTLFPKLRLIFLARDLVDRAWSAMVMELRNSMLGLQAGQFDSNMNNHTATSNEKKNTDAWTLQQLERDADPDKYDDDFFMNRLRHSTHASRSDYATSLRRWLCHFPKEQILIVPYQQLVDDPRQLLGTCLEHVGRIPNANAMVEKLVEHGDLTKRINAGVMTKPPRPSLRIKMERFLQPYAQDFNKLLRELGYKDWSLNEYSKEP